MAYTETYIDVLHIDIQRISSWIRHIVSGRLNTIGSDYSLESVFAKNVLNAFDVIKLSIT